MVGVRGDTRIGTVIALINAGVDIETLRQVRALEEEGAVLVLVNCGLERLSWLDKLRFGKYFDKFHVSYYLKRVGGNGWLLKCGEEPWAIWVDAPGGARLLAEREERFTLIQAEREVRMALADIDRGG